METIEPHIGRRLFSTPSSLSLAPANTPIEIIPSDEPDLVPTGRPLNRHLAALIRERARGIDPEGN